MIFYKNIFEKALKNEVLILTIVYFCAHWLLHCAMNLR